MAGGGGGGGKKKTDILEIYRFDVINEGRRGVIN